MPAVSAVSILAMSGRSSSRQASESGPPERSSRATSAPRLRWPCDHLVQQVAVRAALGLDDLEADPRRVGAEAADDRPGRAHRALDVQHRARVEVDEQDLALGQQRQADLERRGAGPVVEGEERVVGLGGGDQLGAAQLDRAEHPAHQRLAAEGAAGGQLDDRLEVRPHLPVREELGEPVGARAVEQRLGQHRQRLLVGEPHGEQARALGDRQRLDDGLEPLVPARSGQQQPLHGDIARGGLRGEVLDLVEHGRPVREQSHAIHGGGGRGHSLKDRLKRPGLYCPSS